MIITKPFYNVPRVELEFRNQDLSITKFEIIELFLSSVTCRSYIAYKRGFNDLHYCNPSSLCYVITQGE